MQGAGHGAHGAGEGGGDVGAGGGDDPCGERGGVHAVFGRGRPVGVDRLHVLGVGLAAPADHEPFDDGGGLVDLPLGDHRGALPARGLGHVGEGHDGGAGEVRAGLLGIDVEEGFEAPDGREHGERGLDVDADVAGVDGDRERLGGRQAGVEGAVDEQAPDVAEGHVADQVLDVDAPVPQGAALLVGFGDLRLERDDSFESGYEVGHRAAPRDVYDGTCGRQRVRDGRRPWFRGPRKDSRSWAVIPLMPRGAGGHPTGTASAPYPRVPPLGSGCGTQCHPMGCRRRVIRVGGPYGKMAG